MIENTFLEKLAKEITNTYFENFSKLTIILPNKRAKVFLLNELKKEIPQTTFAPTIISIEEFVQEISEIQSVDSIELLFEFYEVYLNITPKENQEPFETFANWAKTLLQDFNEIDRYLLDPKAILKYIEDIKRIENWSVDGTKTEMVEKYLLFWKKLPVYYDAFYNHLITKKIGYQGLIFREAYKSTNKFIAENNSRIFVFAGFNALNNAEEKIIQLLLSNDIAKIHWDIDEYFLKNKHHDAGLFARKIKNEWEYYKNNKYEWIINRFSEEKNIEIIGTPKSVGQAKIVGKLIENQIKIDDKLSKTAVILGDENLLIPVLYALPKTVSALNITMGYSAKNNPVQLLVSKLFKMHNNALSRNNESYVFYYKDVLDVLSNPLIESNVKAQKAISIIKKYNFTYITHSKLYELQEDKSQLFELLFQKWSNDCIVVLQTISKILLHIKSTLDHNNEEEKLTNAFTYSIYKVINKLITYYSKNTFENNTQILQQIYKQLVETAEVSFEGEPLDGLQIMGVLESRVLDFETVIITSVNEGKFPAGKSNNSFIPYDVKKEYGLPTYKEKDAIYTYHFYHLLQRAKNIYLIYNTDGDGFDSGEKSRFITQLDVEKTHNPRHIIYNSKVPEIAYKPLVIPKTESVLQRLEEIAKSGFSPSALTTYIRNPIQFYFQKILRISESDQVEENIAANTLGTIIHKSLEEIYKPFVGKILTTNNLEISIKKSDEIVFNQFKQIYKEGEIKTGKNLLAFEVAKRNVSNFLKVELDAIKNGDIVQIIALEHHLEATINHHTLPYPVKIGGDVDRIEVRNNTIRIIDYKTGKVVPKNVTLTTWSNLTDDSKNDKIIQLLTYAYMFQKQEKNDVVEAGIISFKNIKQGFLPFTFKEDKSTSFSVIDNEMLQNFETQIILILNKILDSTIPFEEKIM